jgi:hypothetical protein
MNDFIKVDDWIPEPEDIKIKDDGQLLVVYFDKIFNRPNDELNYFIIKKDSYVKRLDEISLYINYFIKFYDDGEVLMSYLFMKYMIDVEMSITSMDMFINLIYSILITPTMKEKIHKMVEDNYYIELAPKDPNREYDESLEFTVNHAKVLMEISMAIKIMIPIVFHYLNTINKVKDRPQLFKIYSGLFDIFGDTIDIYSKLYICVSAKINVHHTGHKRMWDQREIVGTTKETKTEAFLTDIIISETIFKFRFYKNIIAFIYVVMDNQLLNFLKENYGHNRIELDSTPDQNGLRGTDKIEMSATKIDESIAVLSKVNITSTIKRLQNKYSVKISHDELEFYKKYVNITPFQTKLVYYFFAKEFGGYRDLLMLNKNQYIKVLIILKKSLLYLGYEYFPQILTATTEKLNTRTIQNNKFLSKIVTSSMYKNVMENKYSIIQKMGKDDYIIQTLSTILNTTFKIVDYDKQELLGEKIELHQDKLSDEFLDYINRI